MAIASTQKFQDRNKLRIKFASIDEYGILTRDASEEYAFLERPLLKGWTAAPAEAVKVVRRDRHSTWRLRTESETIVAVQHETGLEILLAVGVNVASAAVIAFVAWAWKKWRESRAQQIRAGIKQEPTLRLETVEERLPNGRIRTSRKVELRGPLTSAAVARALRDWQRSGAAG